MPTSASGAQTVGPASGAKVTPINNLGTTAIQVIGANQYRASIAFANPGAVTVYVAPLVTATGATFTPTLTTLGGTYPVAAGAVLSISGECATGWQALAASGANNPLTVAESNL